MRYMLSSVFILFCCMFYMQQGFTQVPTARLEFVSLYPKPVIDQAHPDAADVKFGFEGGTAHKVAGTYYLFTTEIFDTPKTAAVRLAVWKSRNGITFKKHSVIVSTNRDWNDTTNRMSPWSPMAVFDTERNVWSVFHVGYRRKSNSTNVFNMSGRIFRYDSKVKGIRGIGGPYVEGGWLDIDKKPDWFEGPGEIVSFYPYKIGKEWWGFYGANSVPNHVDAVGNVNPNAKNIFYAALVKSQGILTDKWVRQSQLNPVLIDPEFVENSVVTKIHDSLYINLYDGANKHEISYACSKDGIHWGKEQLIEIPDAPLDIKHTRTPLCLIREKDGLYSIYFTAFDGKNPDKVEPLWHNGYGKVWRMIVRLTE
ncbi:hypothetical protein [Lacibacter sp.]|uniref:hypothetical protein n=1 Tax=Lacibacter sp. TaxID=1915409 RepID=UPI002B4B3611|nr:hypothetical protein [Lacibacter sp.]HLP38191.1 hypothetical protein [Lacibacter sp.]